MARKRKQPNLNSSNDPFERYEPLREELREYLEVCGRTLFLRHPFCNQCIRDLKKCGWIHDFYDRQVAKYDQCFEAHDYEGCLSCIDIYFQPEWLEKDAEFLPDDTYWSLLGTVYQNQKVTLPERDRFEQLFRSDRPGRELLMSEKERAVLARLPERLRVFRGYSGEEMYGEGVAWTLDERQARWYANWQRTDDDPMLASGMIPKDRVWAYLDGGDILLPSEEVQRRRDVPAFDESARKPWAEAVNPKFDVTRLLVS
jgi:hypothetical protein